MTMFHFDNDLMDNKSFQIVLTLVIVYLVRFLFKLIKRVLSLPPGPWGLPVFGYLPFIRKPLYLEFDSLAKLYGPVYSLKLGKHNVVIINDWNHLKEAFSNESLLSRPHERLFADEKDPPSFVEMSGDLWREHRTTAMSILRKVGLGKSSLEDEISNEIESFLSTIDSIDGIDFEEKILPSISNNIFILLFGRKLDYNNPDKVKLDKILSDFSKTISFAGLTVFLPWLRRIFILTGKINNDFLTDSFQFFNKFYKQEIDAHEEKFDENTINDYVDGYLLERKVRKTKGIDVDDSLDTLRRNVSDFFGAGAETIFSTLAWAMIYLVKYPEFQEKIRTEIEEVIGSERKPMFADRNQMPFTMAFLNETHRHASVLPVNLLRRAAKDTKVGNYNIPKDCIVIFNFWSCHRDSELWDNPEEFNPSRFLTKSSDGEIKVSTFKYLVPFSSGKRACPGEGLAQIELFLYLTNILQKFRVTSESEAEVSMEANYGITRQPKIMPKLMFTKI